MALEEHLAPRDQRQVVLEGPDGLDAVLEPEADPVGDGVADDAAGCGGEEDRPEIEVSLLISAPTSSRIGSDGTSRPG